MKPSDFSKQHPWNSFLGNFESEFIGRNVMIILARNGNEFRELTWDEYKKERMKDSNFQEGEKLYFDKVAKYCSTEESVGTFSKMWKEIKEENTYEIDMRNAYLSGVNNPGLAFEDWFNNYKK